MVRETVTPRPDWKEKVEALGFTFHTVDGNAYWDESAAYRFTKSQIGELERATNELHSLCLEAIEKIIREDRFDDLAIPEAARRPIIDTWEADPPAIYGRFDFVYDGVGDPKLLEYNADTPTSLLEAAVIQWHWLQDTQPDMDQFNSIWEGLVEKWRDLKAEGYLSENVVHFGCMNVPEDVMTTAVLMDAAHENGLRVELIRMEDIGWDQIAGRFVDSDKAPIQTLFKLYPWEWILTDDFGQHALKSMARHQWIEPIWKMLLSNKAILALLWEFYPDHPNLVPAFLDGPREMTTYVRKPLLGREGANISIHGSVEIVTDGPYDGPCVFQAYCPMPEFDGYHPLIGSWVIDCVSRGIGIRESKSLITDDLARFVPHYFVPEHQL